MARAERRGFPNLNVWQKAMVAVKEVYKRTQSFPKDELYGLTSQIRRAACSVPLNIAEGYKRRRYPKDYVRLLVTAHGSQGEVETALEIALCWSTSARRTVSDSSMFTTKSVVC